MSAESERINRLEEAVGFTQHDVDGLSAQVREAYDLIARLSRRVEALEERLEDSGGDAPEEDEKA